MILASSLSRRFARVILFAGVVPPLVAVLIALKGFGVLDPFTADQRLLWPGLIGGLALLGVAGSIALLRLSRDVTRTLASLDAQAEAVARGDLSGRVTTPQRRAGSGCRDELDQISQAFNLMTAQLAGQITERDRYEAELRALNAQLEQRIVDRTRELEETQSHLVRAEKQAALGKLVAGIAHEINNHVTFITSATEPVELGIEDIRQVLGAWHSLVEAPAERIEALIGEAQSREKEVDLEIVDDEIRGALLQMREGAQRIGEIVANLRTFSHSGEETFEQTRIGDIVDQTIALARMHFGDKIEIEKRINVTELVPCLPVQLAQAMVNLLVNAADAITGRGKITISAWIEGGEVCLSVRDNGCGIAPEHISRVTDPFFTTKDVGEGTGLGLFVSEKILEAHGGSLSVESILDEGTEITLQWPIEIASSSPAA